MAHRFDSLTAPVLSYSSNTFFDLLECRNRQQMREEFAAAKLFEIISNLFDNEGVETRYEKLAYDYIQANFMRQIKIEEIADLLKVNRRYLSRLFKTAYGISMQQLLMKSRLDRAALLLQDGVRVSQAASLVGYEDVFHFSKMFKKKFGIAPQFYKATEKLQHY